MSRSVWKKPFSSFTDTSPLDLWINKRLLLVTNDHKSEINQKFVEKFPSSDDDSLSIGKSFYKSNDNKKKQLNFLYQNKIKTQQKTIEIWSRDSMLLPEHLGKNVKIYNGKNWAFRKVVEQMVGHKFGEFCSTRKKTIHKFSVKKKVAKKSK